MQKCRNFHACGNYLNVGRTPSYLLRERGEEGKASMYCPECARQLKRWLEYNRFIEIVKERHLAEKWEV